MRKALPSTILLAALALGLVAAAQAEEMKTIRSAFGVAVRVPEAVPARERYVPAGGMLVDRGIVVLVYMAPERPGRVEYAEAYDLARNLLWIAWDDARGATHLVADENLDNPTAKGPAGTLRLREIAETVF